MYEIILVIKYVWLYLLEHKKDISKKHCSFISRMSEFYLCPSCSFEWWWPFTYLANCSELHCEMLAVHFNALQSFTKFQGNFVRLGQKQFHACPKPL